MTLRRTELAEAGFEVMRVVEAPDVVDGGETAAAVTGPMLGS